jgi:L-serine dehydratase
LFLSVFDLFKIGIGPSSSHTMGPMTAAGRFLDEIANGDWPRPAGAKVDRISVSLHGSLAYTGVGHGTDRAVILGLAGETPQTVDPDKTDAQIASIAAAKRVSPPGHPSYRFDPEKDLVLDRKTPLLGHANGMAFSAYDAADRLLLKRIYYSVGGGFVVSEEELQRLKAKGADKPSTHVPYPFRNAVEMLAMAKKSGLSIA